MKREQKMEENDGGASSVFSSLPEDCISRIIAWTSPKDAIRASTVSWGLKSASESDIVWEGFLPADWKEIISRSVNPPVNYATRKELVLMLCHSPILIDDGRLSFWLSKSSGKKCYMLCARELSFAGQDGPYYWRPKLIPRSRFSEVVGVGLVRWLDIQGKMRAQMLSLETTYAAYLVYKLLGESHGLEVPVKASVRFTEAISSVSNTTELESNFIYLCPLAERRGHSRAERQDWVPQPRPDGWTEIFLGEVYNDEGKGDIEIKLWETEILNWKSCLILEGIELRPKE